MSSGFFPFLVGLRLLGVGGSLHKVVVQLFYSIFGNKKLIKVFGCIYKSLQDNSTHRFFFERSLILLFFVLNYPKNNENCIIVSINYCYVTEGLKLPLFFFGLIRVEVGSGSGWKKSNPSHP